jgi:DnaK suppressor protein
MAKHLAKKVNPVKSSRKTETAKTKKINTVKKTPAAKTTKKVTKATPKPVKKKAVVSQKLVPVKAVAPKPVKRKEKSVKSSPKKPVPANKKTSIIKPLKNTVKQMKKTMPVVPITHETEVAEDYMNVQQQKHFRMILLDWKKQLLGEMERTVHHMQDEAANFPDPNDRATQEEEFSLELRARDRERKLIKKIDEALLRLDNHEYGYCEACGVEIGDKRLSARPTATLCIDCKTIDEIREKHFS